MNTKQLYPLLLGGAILAGVSMPAAAEMKPGDFYVSPMINHIEEDSARKVDDDNNFGVSLGLGYAISNHWNIEAYGVRNRLEYETGNGRYDMLGAGLDALLIYDRSSISPYGLIGAGALWTRSDAVHPMASAALGLLLPLNQQGAAARIEARYRLDQNDEHFADVDSFEDWIIGAGLIVPFGAAPAPAAPAPTPAPAAVAVPAPAAAPAAPAAIALPPADDDSDGVPNGDDQCPNTPAGAKVYKTGCEVDSDFDKVVDSADECPNTTAGVAVDARGCEADADNDKVGNSKDQCPNTPAGIRVDATGCEIDSDKDGVVDSADKCPGTAAGTRIDNQGCELKDVIVLKGVTFATDSAQLIGDSRQVLDEMASIIKRNKEMVVEIRGYTDSHGSEPHNVQLSQRRAEAVRDYLISKGVPPISLTAKGYGSKDPIADNYTATGRAANRRVELHRLE
ncbi:MAG: OmpA family protein [Pseudomonadota bacterium]